MTTVQEYIPIESLKLQALQERALELWEIDQTSALELGKALCAVRDAMRDEHGAFSKWYRANGLEENRVYYCIRRAERKAAQPTPAPVPVGLNKNNLALAKYALPHDKFGVSCVRVGPDGTTTTDGFVLMRVSLPEGSTCAESGFVPAGFMSKLTGPVELTFGRDAISAKSDDITHTTVKCQGDFPPVEKIIDAHPPCQNDVAQSGIAFRTNVHNLIRLLRAMGEMAEKEVGYNPRTSVGYNARISVYPDILRVDFVSAEGQKFEGFVTTQGV